jgi:C-methyltransferase C-terminal domain/Putative zinc binding domain/Methyltransferase domain
MSNGDASVREVVDCRVCGNRDWQDIIRFGEVPLANGFLEAEVAKSEEPRYPLGVLSCRTCRLMSLTHIVSPVAMYRSYLYVTSRSDTMIQHMRYVAQGCLDRFHLKSGELVVEMGSNTGAQLMFFRDLGLRVLGVDPARNLALLANRDGIDTLPEFFSESTAKSIAQKYGPARLILGRHVFAHIDDLAGVLAGVRGLLDPAGVFAIEVPYALDLLDRTAFDTIYHEHLSYFTIQSLIILLGRHGLRLFDVERLAIHGGSILAFVALEEAAAEVKPSVDELLLAEHHSGLGGDLAYQQFADRVQQVTFDLTSLVRGLRSADYRIAGYGASAKGNTILNVCGLGREDIEFCIDNTPFKQGRLLPGTHIPVKPPNYAARCAPDYYLLLAWNYAEEILRKEQEFLESGGKFIIPIPSPSIVSSEPRQ